MYTIQIKLQIREYIQGSMSQPAGVSAPTGQGKNENFAHGVLSCSAIASSADSIDRLNAWQSGHQFTPSDNGAGGA